MKFSEVTIKELKDYLRVDGDYEDELLESILKAGKESCRRHTGLTDNELDKLDDVVIALYVICADMYENRISINQGNTKPNEVFKAILDGHSVNLL